jgi:hypothetical protein
MVGAELTSWSRWCGIRFSKFEGDRLNLMKLTMGLANSVLLLALMGAGCAGGFAQTTGGGNAADSSAQGGTNPAAPSGLLQPALDSLQKTIGGLNQEKWKKGTIRSEAETNIQAIQRDLQMNLPPLLQAADAAPNSTRKALPVSRNIDALYDVLLRVLDGARVVAPGDQVGQLQDALNGLDKSRMAWNDRIQDDLAAQEKQIGELQAALKVQTVPVAAACPVAETKAAAVPAKKSVRKKKPAATGTSSGAAPASGTAKPTQ